MTLKDQAYILHAVNNAYRKVCGEEETPLTTEVEQGIIEAIQRTATNTPEQLHAKWCCYKKANGWTYGEIQDNEKKKHPCLVPYAELSEKDKFKDKKMK